MTIMTTCFIPCGAKLPIIAMFAGAFFGGSGTIAFSAYVLGVLSIIISGIMLKKFKILPATRLRSSWSCRAITFRPPATYSAPCGSAAPPSSRRQAPLSCCPPSSCGSPSATAGEGGAFCAVSDIDNSIMARIGSVIAPIFTLPGFGYMEIRRCRHLRSGRKGERCCYLRSAVSLRRRGCRGRLRKSGASWLRTLRRSARMPSWRSTCCAHRASRQWGAIKREMNNGKWTAFAIGYMCAYAYVVSTIIYQIGGLITGELTFGVGTVICHRVHRADHLPAVPQSRPRLTPPRACAA